MLHREMAPLTAMHKGVARMFSEVRTIFQMPFPPPPPHAPKGEVTVSLSVFTVSLQCRRAVQAFSLSAQCAREIAMLKLPKRGGDGASQRER